MSRVSDATARDPGNDERAFAFAFLTCSALVLLPIWAVRYPPLVDLGQHATQIQLWRDFADLDPAIATRLELRPLTPYLGCYLLGRLFFAVLPPLAAMKALVSLAFLALPAATLGLLRVFGRSRWWSLAAFPVAYSVNASWGLLNFMLALPLAVVLVTLAVADAGEPRPRRSPALLLVALVLLISHGLVCALSLAIAGALALVASRSLADLLRRSLPLIPAGIAGVAWFAATASGEGQVTGNAVWGLTPIRLLTLPVDFLAREYGPVAMAVSVGLAALLATAIRPGDGDRRATLCRLLPFAAAAAVYLAGPLHLFLAAFVQRRFAPLVLVFALPLVRSGDPGRWRRFALVGLVAIASLDLTARALRFDAEARPLDEAAAAIEPGKRVLALVFDPSTPGLEGASHLVQHVAWVQVARGAWVDFNFTFFYHELVHLRDTAAAGYTYLLLWRPQAFDPTTVHGDYDYFVAFVRGPDPGPVLFHDAPFPWRRVGHAGSWWVYARTDR